MFQALRYFAIVGLHPSYALVLLALVVAIGGWSAFMNPADLDSGLGMLLFVQMFLASSGFAIRARQGHFDPILTGARSRSHVAVAHWLLSALPGIAAWLLLVSIGRATGSPAAASAIAGDRLAALAIVSCTAWAAGFMLPRGAGGVIWIAALAGLLVARADPLMFSTFSFGKTIAHAAAVLICPFLLIGLHPPMARGAVPGAVSIAAALWLSAVYVARRIDIYLVDRA
jgi:hypothetical protein